MKSTNLIRRPKPKPSGISGLHVWYSALSEVAADGAAVLPQDQSGNGRHLTQATSGLRATLDADGLNGRPAYRHTAASTQRMQTAAWTALPQPFTAFVVCTLPGASQTVFDGIASGNRLYLNVSSVIRMYSGVNLNSAMVSPQVAAIWEVCADGTNSYIAHNGVVVGAGDAGTNTLTGLIFGANFNGTANYYDGLWSEFALYSKRLTTTERRHVLGALA